MGKMTIQDIASRLMERKDLSKKQASRFVNEMFTIIQHALDEEKLVKVKGLGTFRIIDVEERESINVNTGDRMLIEKHEKITFTPDSLMKELVNKPFSQFETVVLNEGVDFEDAKETEEPEEALNPEPEAPVVETPVATIEEETKDEQGQETEDEQEQEQETGEELEEEMDSGRKNWKWPLIALAAGVAGLLIGFMIGREMNVEPWKPTQPVVEQPKEKPVVNQTVAEKPVELKKDIEVKAPAPVAEKEQKVVEPDDFSKYEQMDSRVRTGAYRIVGLDHKEKVRAGDNLARICKRTLGPGMECYLQVFNGIKGDADIKAGQEIMIPKLELKKKKAQK